MLLYIFIFPFLLNKSMLLLYKISFCVALVTAFAISSSEGVSSRLNKRETLNSCVSSNRQSEQIKSSFQFAYNGYKEFAWGHDELLPVLKSYSDSR